MSVTRGFHLFIALWFLGSDTVFSQRFIFIHDQCRGVCMSLGCSEILFNYCTSVCVCVWAGRPHVAYFNIETFGGFLNVQLDILWDSVLISIKHSDWMLQAFGIWPIEQLEGAHCLNRVVEILVVLPIKRRK